MDADSENRRALLPRPNGRTSIPLVVNKEGRQSLFQKQSRESLKADTRPNLGRNAYSDGLSALAATTGPDRLSGAVSPTPSVTSSNGDGASRIPRPNSAAGVFSKARQQISLTEAYRMAEAEEDRYASPRTLRLSPAPVDGSPSPAPRPRPLSRASDGRQTRQAANNRQSANFGRRSQTPQYPGARDIDNDTVRSADSLSSSSSFDRRFGQFAEEQQRPYSPSNRFSNNGVDRQASRIPEAGRLTKRASTSSLSTSPQPPAFSKGHVPKGWVAHLLAREERGIPAADRRHSSSEYAPDVPIPSVETEIQPQEPTPPSSRPASADVLEPSPNKSFGWQVDQDFTAGDLQISDSPRISTVGLGAAMSRANTKLDEIRQREIEQQVGTPDFPREPEVQQKNTKLDEIQQLEEELDQAAAAYPEDAAPQRNVKLDEIREREKTFMSKKALAANRLDDIREQNSMSRSLSPETQAKPRNSEVVQEAVPTSQPAGTPAKVPSSQADEDGEKIPNTPVTIFRGGNRGTVGEEAAAAAKSRRDVPHSRNGSTHARSDSRDLLRQLARAASASPGASDKNDSGETKLATRHAEETDDNRWRHLPLSVPASVSSENENNSRSVGLVGARRTSSTESTKEKRSSRAMSDNDPTDRIEGEIQLFALGDNQSERGSVRAPSVGPPSEDEDEDEPTETTPRPAKRDVASMPTPKVVGAYVETPAPTKVEERLSADVGQKESTSATVGKGVVGSRPLPTTSDRSRSRPRSKLYVTETHDEDGALKSTGLEPNDTPAVAAPGLRRRRTRSLPRTRGPLLNSVKPPTVRDDLLEIQRTYQIEDSTLDDFEQLLVGSKAQLAPSSDIDRLLTELSTKRQEIEANPDKDHSELERYNRMSKTLTDGLMGIRSAKLGIERLEGNLAHADHPLPVASATEKLASSLKPADLPASTATSNKPIKPVKAKSTIASEELPVQAVTYLQVPLPSLYRRKPFRFTFLGSILLAFSLWFIAESAMCAQYCRPETCSPSNGPCIWEPSDPFWGSAIPVKLDQWITNGEGRQLYEQLSEDLSDKYLDAWEYITGSDIHDVNMASLDFLGKRQHRRRLRKRGLVKPVDPTPEQKAKWDAIHEARLAIERKREMQEAGYDVEDEMESFEADEAL